LLYSLCFYVSDDKTEFKNALGKRLTFGNFSIWF